MAEETKNTKPADEEIEKTAEPTAGEEKQPETDHCPVFPGLSPVR